VEKGVRDSKSYTHGRKIRKLFAKGLKQELRLRLGSALVWEGKVFAKLVGVQIYEQTTTKLCVVVAGRRTNCMVGLVVESKMKCDLWSYKSKFGA